jgi:hypothetical protein
MRKAAVFGEVLVLVFMGIGFGQLGFLAGMDAQATKLINQGRCNSYNYVYGVYPKFNRETGKIERITYKAPCDKWAEKFN